MVPIARVHMPGGGLAPGTVLGGPLVDGCVATVGTAGQVAIQLNDPAFVGINPFTDPRGLIQTIPSPAGGTLVGGEGVVFGISSAGSTGVVQALREDTGAAVDVPYDVLILKRVVLP
jgi:hypothetical protein